MLSVNQSHRPRIRKVSVASSLYLCSVSSMNISLLQHIKSSSPRVLPRARRWGGGNPGPNHVAINCTIPGEAKSATKLA